MPRKSNRCKSSTLVADTPMRGDLNSAWIFCHVHCCTLSLLRVSETACRMLISMRQKSNIKPRRSEWFRWKHICVDASEGKLVAISSSTCEQVESVLLC